MNSWLLVLSAIEWSKTLQKLTFNFKTVVPWLSLVNGLLNYPYYERFEPRSHFKSGLSLIVQVTVVLNRTVVVDSDWCFDNLCGSHLQSQSELYHVSWWYYTRVIDLIGQLRCNIIGRLSVKPWLPILLGILIL